MAIDNNHIYPSLISIVSALENNNREKNLLAYNLLLSFDFMKEKIKIFESLKKKYDVRINYYLIPKIFYNFRKWRMGTDSIYYKLLIPMIFPSLERILYLDGDTLIYKDLFELYSLPLFNNYILATPSPIHEMPKNFKLKDNIYINAGVNLINIKKIRQDKKDFELLYYCSKYSHLFNLPEQDLINYVYRGNIGVLPFKYGIYLYGNVKIFKKFHSYKYKISIKTKDIIEALNEPTIVHLVYCEPKVWTRRTKSTFGIDYICKYYQKEFYYFARKTDYYNEILRKYMN